MTHPRWYAYLRGCRCLDCTEAARLTAQANIAQARARGAEDPRLIPHGTTAGYRNWGCRCEACRAANTAGCKASRMASRMARS